VGIGRDGLRSLLDVLVQSVSTGGSGAGVAARAHVSRFHFDRLVAAALRETPAAFRRRLLLERAAHGLAGGATVVEAALDAGCRTPESFARAFRRAYGVAPSRFAAAGTGFRLPAANGIHFHPPGALVVPGTDPRRCLRERLRTAGPRFAGLVRDAGSRGAWDTAFVDATCDPPESLTYGGIAAHVVTWSAHRRHLVLDASPDAGSRSRAPTHSPGSASTATRLLTPWACAESSRSAGSARSGRT
jgi:AraC-like DNA-binding protein